MKQVKEAAACMVVFTVCLNILVIILQELLPYLVIAAIGYVAFILFTRKTWL